MSNDEAQKKCPICDEDYLLDGPTLAQNCISYRCECRRCGKYEYGRELSITGTDFDRVRHLVSAWIRRNQDPRRPPLLREGINGRDWLQFEHMGFPIAPEEKMDALLAALAEEAGDRYTSDIAIGWLPHLISKIAAKNVAEVESLNMLLGQVGYVESGYYGHASITASGWKRISELRKSTHTGDAAFLAMWYDGCTKDYRQAVEAAVMHCGYRFVVVDQEQFNGFVMDQVVSLIRQARFVIADFTCRKEEGESGKVKCGVRGGVYWEAGMAFGLGKPVIHTCEDSLESKNRRHFDVDQYSTIFWKPEELSLILRERPDEAKAPNFTEKLATRILATVKRGSYVSEKK